MQPRIMFIERKAHVLPCWWGPSSLQPAEARIGRVTFSKTGKTIYYGGRSFARNDGRGAAGNYYDTKTGQEYWISGPKKNGKDLLYVKQPVEIDEDVRAEYWTRIRGCPLFVNVERF